MHPQVRRDSQTPSQSRLLQSPHEPDPTPPLAARRRITTSHASHTKHLVNIDLANPGNTKPRIPRCNSTTTSSPPPAAATAAIPTTSTLRLPRLSTRPAASRRTPSLSLFRLSSDPKKDLLCAPDARRQSANHHEQSPLYGATSDTGQDGAFCCRAWRRRVDGR